MRKLILILLILSLSAISFGAPIGDLDSETLAISLVIDTSGSMRQTDPQRLRQSVAEVFIDYLNPEDYLGIITFNSEVDLVIPMQNLEDDWIRDDMKESLSESIEGVRDTDYQAALDQANNQLQGLNDENPRKIIIFLTDGQPDPDPANMDQDHMATYMDELWETVSIIGSNQFPVYSIGFTDDLDIQVLNRIASETNGSVRIYEDVDALDENLIQLLQSRESIVQELLEPQDPVSDLRPGLKPRIVSEFWFSNRGYRTGHEVLASGSLMAGNLRVRPGGNLVVDSFDLLIEYDDGSQEVIPIFDSGSPDHGDVSANDGIWSNRVSLHKPGTANASLIMSGTMNDENIDLQEDLGEFMVAEPGYISLTGHNIPAWIRSNDNLIIPLTLVNDSEFVERVRLDIDDEFASVTQPILDLDPNSVNDIELEIILNNNLGLGTHDFVIDLIPLEDSTEIDNGSLDYSIELVGRFEALRREFLLKSNIILPILAIVIGIPVIIYIFGMVFYLLLVRRQLRVRGILRYWKGSDPENWEELNLSRLKKKKIIISFDDEGVAHYRIPNSSYNYSLELYTDLISKRPGFILGWKALFTRKSPTELIITTSQPGIIHHEGEILTRMYLYDKDEFFSGDYSFRYYLNRRQRPGFKKANEGKNILEGRV